MDKCFPNYRIYIPEDGDICLACIVDILCVFVYLICICCTLNVLVIPYVYVLYYVCIAILTLDAGLLARSQ